MAIKFHENRLRIDQKANFYFGHAPPSDRLLRFSLAFGFAMFGFATFTLGITIKYKV